MQLAKIEHEKIGFSQSQHFTLMQGVKTPNSLNQLNLVSCKNITQ